MLSRPTPQSRSPETQHVCQNSLAGLGQHRKGKQRSRAVPATNNPPNPNLKYTQAASKNIATKANLSSPLILYNRTQQRADDLSAALPADKTTVAPTVVEAVSKADIIFTCLANDAAISSTLDAALAANDVSRKLFVDCSTVHPDTTNALAKQAQDAGAAFVACPGRQLSSLPNALTDRPTFPHDRREVLTHRPSFRRARHG